MATILQTPGPSPREDFDPNKHPIVFDGVSIGFGDNLVLDSISFSLNPGETKVLLGVSGSGKTLILKLAMGLIRPDSGRIFVLGEEVTAMKEEDLFALRRRIGMVFQESALFDSLKVEENVAFRLMEEHIDPEEVHRRVLEALTFVELANTTAMFPAELSGGMRRRVAIARAIVTQPEILLYDSPTGGLDPVTSTTIIELLIKQRDFYKTSALLVTHRLQDAFTMATHVFNPQTSQMERIPPNSGRDLHTNFIILKDAHILFEGTALQMVHSTDEYIRDFLS